MKKNALITTALMLVCCLLAPCLAGCTCFIPESMPDPGEGGVLNLYGIDPLTLDPAVSGEGTSHEYIMQLFGGLVCLGDDMRPAPDIATSWQTSADGLTYTFHLRDDVFFHDGRKVVAADFKYSWERACQPATGSQTAATYLGDIVGVKEVLAGQATKISGVSVRDDRTLQVTIDAPKTYFLSKLTYPTAFVVDRDNVASGRDWWHQPNGTGPFRLGQWQKNSRLILTRNELYYGEKAKIELAVFHLYGGVPIFMYETGEIDVTGVSATYIDKIRDEAGPFYRELSTAPELSFHYIGFNVAEPPFDDADIRRAFTMAIDKDKLISLRFRGMIEKAEGILPPGLPGYNPALAGLEFDVARARELISNSAYGDAANLPPITLTTLGRGGWISPSLEAIIHEWRQNLGVEVKVRQLEPERFLYHLKQERDEMFDAGWIADYPHPQNFLEILFRTGADINYGGYSNPQVDALLQEAGTEADYETSLALYQQAEQILVEDAACLPLWFGKNYMLTKPYVSGYNPSPLGFVHLNRVTVAPH